MANQHHTNVKPSDVMTFFATVYTASATMMDFETYLEVYGEIMEIMFWNNDIDTSIALNQEQH